ncbi:MAG: hypothetical protein QM479_15295 [Pseudomonadota bacterium]
MILIKQHPPWIWISSLFIVFFGLKTIESGGSVLFFDGQARLAAGHYVLFVLWFNFIAGFFYVVAGIGLWYRKNWALILSVLLAFSTILVFAAFGIYIYNGGDYEQRTIAAMTLRSIIWVVVSIKAYDVIVNTKLINQTTKSII